MDWKIPLTEPDLGEEEIAAVTRVLQSKWLTMGAVTAEFEQQFADRLGVKHAFAVNNATAALHMANLALGLGPGDEVICPALTFVASANASRYTGAEVAFADIISPDDLTIDPAEIEALITPATKAITVVHYGGFPADMDAIMAIAGRHNLRVIEDCAHTPFAWYDSANGERRFTGTVGDIGCFSFFGNKNMTTGEGGMLTTNDDALAGTLRLLRSHGMTTLTYDRHKGHASGYDVVMLGYNYRTDEIHSAIGLAQLEKIDRLNAGRREVFQLYRDVFAGHPRVSIPFSQRSLDGATCHIMPVIVHEGYEEAKARLKAAGVQTSKHYDLVCSFSIYRNSRSSAELFDPGHLMTLPLSPFMTREDVEYIRAQIE